MRTRCLVASDGAKTERWNRRYPGRPKPGGTRAKKIPKSTLMVSYLFPIYPSVSSTAAVGIIKGLAPIRIVFVKWGKKNWGGTRHPKQPLRPPLLPPLPPPSLASGMVKAHTSANINQLGFNLLPCSIFTISRVMNGFPKRVHPSIHPVIVHPCPK